MSAEISERDLELYKEFCKTGRADVVAQKFNLTETRIRQIRSEVALKKKKYTWVNNIIYPNVKKWFKENRSGIKRMEQAGIRADSVTGFLCDDARALSIKSVKTMLEVMNLEFEVAFKK